MLLRAEQHGAMVIDVLQNDWHRPFVDGKANRDNIEEAIVQGIYAKKLPPIDQTDVDWICDLVDSMIEQYGDL